MTKLVIFYQSTKYIIEFYQAIHKNCIYVCIYRKNKVNLHLKIKKDNKITKDNIHKQDGKEIC